MPAKIYHKLVRDRIPEIIEADGIIYVYETLTDEDYLHLLKQKRNEEAVVKVRGWTLEELEQTKRPDQHPERGFEFGVVRQQEYYGRL